MNPQYQYVTDDDKEKVNNFFAEVIPRVTEVSVSDIYWTRTYKENNIDELEADRIMEKAAKEFEVSLTAPDKIFLKYIDTFPGPSSEERAKMGLIEKVFDSTICSFFRKMFNGRIPIYQGMDFWIPDRYCLLSPEKSIRKVLDALEEKRKKDSSEDREILKGLAG